MSHTRLSDTKRLKWVVQALPEHPLEPRWSYFCSISGLRTFSEAVTKLSDTRHILRPQRYRVAPDNTGLEDD